MEKKKPMKVALKCLNNSQNISNEFLDEDGAVIGFGQIPNLQDKLRKMKTLKII
ncbi:10789_t:CDS:2 [Acaulospora morrowiae]|uniref:10789_t:CDS:1 n=1 Tax=Acaulospora morrowiae TaxID=94023 RepID=A0A9N9AZ28_9GLOM|nr:10789_t:CDS:2 [Acaulospora morrowiae]